MSVSEEFKPNNGDAPAAVKSTQLLESNQAGANTPSGVPGAQTNQPPVPGTAPVTGTAAPLQGTQSGSAAGNFRKEASTNFEVDRTQKTVRNSTGSIKRLSAAVVVNHRVTTDARGRTTSTPLTPEELEKLTALVEQGLGISKERGDTVKVINTAFRPEPATPKAEDLPVWKQVWVQDMLRAAAMPAALAFVALLIVLTTLAFASLDTATKHATTLAPVLMLLWFRYLFQAVVTFGLRFPVQGKELLLVCPGLCNL